MKHIFLIDPLENLVIHKDSSLLLAHTAQSLGYDCYLLHQDNLYFSSQHIMTLKVSTFKSSLKENSFYLQQFQIDQNIEIELVAGDIIYMRLDPPFNLHYLHTLWLLHALENKGVIVKNAPQAIAGINEKLGAYTRDNYISSWVGYSEKSAVKFVLNLLKEGERNFIFKPLDLFQGIGVEKISFSGADIKSIETFFIKKRVEYGGAVVIQPFIEDIHNGEIRALFFKSQELGSILKIPAKGEFLANIAQGATYSRVNLPQNLYKKCVVVAQELERCGIDFIAFDLLGGAISEINITCPGLLVEVSNACQSNLAIKFFS